MIVLGVVKVASLRDIVGIMAMSILHGERNSQRHNLFIYPQTPCPWGLYISIIHIIIMKSF